ncbi:MAG: potassium/proton antiporter [Angelakisella sp.]|nr:potassium/proton antiporter [Angelakisella sp.]
MSYLLVCTVVILLCVLVSRLTHKLGVPVLLAFIALGMLFGENGIFRIPFDNYQLSEQICTIALIFIMFYGGFGTNWDEAKPVAIKAAVLASLGVVLTAALTGAVCILFLKLPVLDAMLLGAILSSTDAASVFSVLRSKKLGLRENTASLLEVESGSNDPFAYMLTITLLSVMSGSSSGTQLLWLTMKQLLFGILFGVAIALLVREFLRHYHFPVPGFDMAFFIGIALLSYALPAALGGNGYLSAYIVGIILGNCRIRKKKSLVHFFDGFTSLMQMLIFFLLGLLATPARIPQILIPAIIIALLLTFVVRPLAVTICLTPLGCSIRQQLLVSFAGLRGAASIVFAIMATVHEAQTSGDLFHMVFCIVLLSIAFQGSLLAPVARWLGMCDQSIDDAKSFSDYTDQVKLYFINLEIYDGHSWEGKPLHEINLPPDMLVIMLLRNGENVLQGGDTIFHPGDSVILSAPAYQDEVGLALQEKSITQNSPWVGKTIAAFSPKKEELVVMILRGEQTIIPNGDTTIEAGDVLVISEKKMSVL